MTLWNIPTPAVFAVMAVVLYVGLFSMKIQKIAFNLASQFATKKGSGVSARSMNSFCNRVTPVWVRALGWLSSLGAFLILIYLWLRFGWPWALAYAAGDHLLKTFGFPILPTVKQGYSILERHAPKGAPDMATQIREHRDLYVHEEAPEVETSTTSSP